MLVLISVTRPNRVMNQHKARDSPEWTAASSSNTYCLCKHLLRSSVVYGLFSKVPELRLLSEVYSHMSGPHHLILRSARNNLGRSQVRFGRQRNQAQKEAVIPDDLFL